MSIFYLKKNKNNLDKKDVNSPYSIRYLKAYLRYLIGYACDFVITFFISLLSIRFSIRHTLVGIALVIFALYLFISGKVESMEYGHLLVITVYLAWLYNFFMASRTTLIPGLLTTLFGAYYCLLGNIHHLHPELGLSHAQGFLYTGLFFIGVCIYNLIHNLLNPISYEDY